MDTSLDNCVLPLEKTGIKPGSVVLVKKGALAALATVNSDANTATEMEYLESGGRSEFFNRTENLANFDLSKYPDCNQLVDNPYLSDF